MAELPGRAGSSATWFPIVFDCRRVRPHGRDTKCPPRRLFSFPNWSRRSSSARSDGWSPGAGLDLQLAEVQARAGAAAPFAVRVERQVALPHAARLGEAAQLELQFRQ